MTAPKRRPRHGTKNGYHAHAATRRAVTPDDVVPGFPAHACQPCKDAYSAYMRDYRTSRTPADPDSKVRVSYRLLSLLAANAPQEVRAEVENELGALRAKRIDETRSA